MRAKVGGLDVAHSNILNIVVDPCVYPPNIDQTSIANGQSDGSMY